jgi:hypothetical protein
MPLTNLSKGGLIALIISLAGCQTVQENTVAVSQTDITSDRVSSTEPNLTDVIEPSLSDEAMYDPLAIVRELGEAIDSPNVNESVDENDPEVEPKTDLAAIEETVWAEIINGFALEDLKETKYADLHRRRLTHSPGFFFQTS